jgi:hypothetical protein
MADEGEFANNTLGPSLGRSMKDLRRSEYRLQTEEDCANNGRCSRSRALYSPCPSLSTLNHGFSILYLVALLLTHEGQLLTLHRLSKVLNQPTFSTRVHSVPVRSLEEILMTFRGPRLACPLASPASVLGRFSVRASYMNQSSVISRGRP